MHDGPVFPNLWRDVQPDGPNHVWVADLTYRLPHFLEEVYNRRRLHSALGYRPSEEYEGPTCADRTVGQFRRNRLSTFRASLHSGTMPKLLIGDGFDNYEYYNQISNCWIARLYYEFQCE